MKDSTRSIIYTASHFFSGTMLSRISGLLRDISMAYAFGTQSAIAALLVAFRFAHLLRRLLGEGALQTAFIPHFESLRKENCVRASQFFVDLNLSLSVILIGIVLAVSIGLGGLYLSDILSPGNMEIVWLTLLMMPSLLFICLFGVNTSLLQCEKSYFIPSAAPIAFNAAWIVGIFSVGHLETAKAMSWLAGFIVVGCCLQWVVTLPKTWQIIHNSRNLNSLWQKSKLFSNDVKLLAAPLILGIFGIAASQISSALDAIFARWADPQGPALLWYAIRLQQLPLALFGVALSGALLPPLSRALRAEDNTSYHTFLDFALKRSFALMLPITAALFILGDYSVSLIYGYGDFSDRSIVGTTQALWGYGVGLVPMTLVLVLAPAFYAQKDYKTPALASIGTVCVSCFLCLGFVGFLGLGAPSVAFATGISSWVNLFWLGMALYRRQGSIISPASVPFFSKIAVISLISLAVTLWGAHTFLSSSSTIDILMGRIPIYPRTIEPKLFQFLGMFAFFGFSFSVLAIATRTKVSFRDLIET